MGFIIVNIVLALVPSLLLLLYFYRRDRQKREPISLVWKIFAIGCLSVVPAGIIELVLDAFSGYFAGPLLIFIRAFIIAALVEESLKLSVVHFFVYNRKEFDEVVDGIVYTISASLGFAFFENMLYSFGPPATLVIRGITAVPLHAIASGIMGYYIGISKMGGVSMIGKGLFYAVLIHGLYDYFLFTGTIIAFLVIPLLIICWFILRNLTNKALEIDKKEGHGYEPGTENDQEPNGI